MDKTRLVILLLLALLRPSLVVTRGYHYVQLLKTWTEARSYCRENFVDLATIATAEDWARVSKIMESADRLAWIGLHYTANSWRWSIDSAYLDGDGSNEFGEWFVFTNQGSGYCVEFVGGGLYGSPCTVFQKSVCYDELTNKYIAVTVPMTWYSARSHCREKYTDLTSMRTLHEKEAITSVTDESHWWVGLTRVNWRWTDQSTSLFRRFANGEPNGGAREPCVCTLVGYWADVHCSRTLPFICSVPLMKLLKVVLKGEGSVDLNDPTVQEAVLNHMEKQMKDHGIHQKFRLRWRKQPNGEIFNKK